MQKAISTCFKKYVDFSGRATRSEYWYFYLFFWLVYLAVRVIEKLTGSIFLNLVLSFSLLGLLPPLIAAGVRRVHDVGKSGWYAFIPIYNIVLYCTPTVVSNSFPATNESISGSAAAAVLQPIPGAERPGRGPTIAISILFGPFGAIPANNAAKQARERGYPAQPYWTAFWVSWLASSAAVVVVSIAVSLAFLGFLVHGTSNNSAAAVPQTTASTFSPTAVVPSATATNQNNVASNSPASSSVGAWNALASSSDGSQLEAVKNGGRIYVSTNSGLTWTPRGPVDPKPWISIASSADGVHLVAATNAAAGEIYTSSDSGLTWTPSSPKGAWIWIGVASSADGSHIVAVTSNTTGQSATSSDYGLRWTSHSAEKGLLMSWGTSVASSSDGAQIFAAGTGQIYVSTDYGLTWTSRAPVTKQGSWLSITSSADGTHPAAASETQIYISADSGQTWIPSGPLATTSKPWSSIVSSGDGKHLAAVEYDGLVYLSSDFGQSWTPTSLVLAKWGSVSSSESGKNLAAAGATQIYTSSDFGRTWIARNVH